MVKGVVISRARRHYWEDSATTPANAPFPHPQSKDQGHKAEDKGRLPESSLFSAPSRLGPTKEPRHNSRETAHHHLPRAFGHGYEARVPRERGLGSEDGQEA